MCVCLCVCVCNVSLTCVLAGVVGHKQTILSVPSLGSLTSLGSTPPHSSQQRYMCDRHALLCLGFAICLYVHMYTKCY
jgi:hypothetical protein